MSQLSFSLYFNPRSLTGATAASLACSRSCIFQSTLPYGSDSGKGNNQFQILHFNPRSLTGATRCTNSQNGGHRDFNPRSLTGATLFHACFNFFCRISIHAPLRERQVRSSSAPAPKVFQSTLPYGSENIRIQLRTSICISIHAPLRERRHTAIIKVI